jgi:hypothetical protein
VRAASRSALFAAFFICGASTNGLIQTHFIPLCADFGLPAVGAASVLAMMGIFDFIGTVGSGWLSDRYDNRWLLAWYYGLRGLSLMALPFTDFSFYGLSIFAVFYGLDWIATVPPTVKLTAATSAASARTSCSAGSSPVTRSAPPARRSSPDCRAPCWRPTCRRSSSPGALRDRRRAGAGDRAPRRGGDRRAEPRAGEGLSRSPDERVSVTSGIGELRADGVTPPKP